MAKPITMGNIIYWKQYDEPMEFIEKIGDKEHNRVISGEYVCEDDRVEKFWVYGCSSVNPLKTGIQTRAAIILKGREDRWESEPIDLCPEPDNAQSTLDTLISQAEQYLKELI